MISEQSKTVEKPTLVSLDEGLSLKWKDMILRGDFTEKLPRIRPRNLSGELIVKAAKIGQISRASSEGDTPPLAIDATAGLGEDALLLAAAGFRVKLYERDETIFSLLEDSVKRALLLPDDEEYKSLKAAVSRMEILNEDSINAMRNYDDSDLKPDVILLDPMFPERQKSSLVGKKLQILQQLESPCDDEEELLAAALSLNPKRIIIKRPPKGPYLAGIKPSFSYSGKSVRIDCIVR